VEETWATRGHGTPPTHVLHDRSRSAHRVVAGIEDLVGTPRVGVVDDRLRDSTWERRPRCSSATGISTINLTARAPTARSRAGHEDQFGKSYITSSISSTCWHIPFSRGPVSRRDHTEMPSSTHCIDRVHLLVVDRDLGKVPAGKPTRRGCRTPRGRPRSGGGVHASFRVDAWTCRRTGRELLQGSVGHPSRRVPITPDADTNLSSAPGWT